MIELCIPSVLDSTLAPKGCHVASVFTQYIPYSLSTGPWTEQDEKAYANTGQYTCTSGVFYNISCDYVIRSTLQPHYQGQPKDVYIPVWEW